MLIIQIHKLLSLVEHALTPVILYNDVQHTSPSSLPHETLPGIIAQLDMCKNIVLSRAQVLELHNLAKDERYNLANHAFVQESPEGMYTQSLKNDFLDKLKDNITAQINRAVQDKAKTLVTEEPSIEVQLRRFQRLIEQNKITDHTTQIQSLLSETGISLGDGTTFTPENFANMQRKLVEDCQDAAKKSGIITCLKELFEKEHDDTLLNKTKNLKSALKAGMQLLLEGINDKKENLEGSPQWEGFFSSVGSITSKLNTTDDQEYDIATGMKDLRTLIEAYPKGLPPQENIAGYEIAQAIKDMLKNDNGTDADIHALFEKYRQDLREAEDPREFATLINSDNGADVTKSPIYQVASALEEIPSLLTEICYRQPALVQQATIQAPQKSSLGLSSTALQVKQQKEFAALSKEEKTAIKLFVTTAKELSYDDVIAIQLKTSAQQAVFDKALRQLETWASTAQLPPVIATALGRKEQLTTVIEALKQVERPELNEPTANFFY